jgi:hypothetical protein
VDVVVGEVVVVLVPLPSSDGSPEPSSDPDGSWEPGVVVAVVGPVPVGVTLRDGPTEAVPGAAPGEEPPVPGFADVGAGGAMPPDSPPPPGDVEPWDAVPTPPVAGAVGVVSASARASVAAADGAMACRSAGDRWANWSRRKAASCRARTTSPWDTADRSWSRVVSADSSAGDVTGRPRA